MSRYVLMPAAKEDLTDIRDYYLEQAGYRVARQIVVEFVEAFRFLAGTPGAGHQSGYSSIHRTAQTVEIAGPVQCHPQQCIFPAHLPQSMTN